MNSHNKNKKTGSLHTSLADPQSVPVYGSHYMIEDSPSQTIPDKMMPPDAVYQLIKDETFSQTQPQLNLASFVTTYMDEYATRLMNEAININSVDETEYPRIAVMNQKCINIMANLWNSPEKEESKAGALGIGSSEACMLGGVAALMRWKERRKAKKKPFDKPNLVISACYQVVWEKFAQFWDIEMRLVPVTHEKPSLDAADAVALCDENTICVVSIQGVTYTGLNDDAQALDAALDEYNAKTGNEVCIHIDAATGGYILPFLKPEVVWDFRLKWVLSISTSAHKFGLVYPGIGWVVWKERKYLPKAMAFSVDYLGANVIQVGMNYSRPAAQILGQYYQFCRLGREGYTAIQTNSMNVAKYARDAIGAMSPFKLYGDEMPNPLFIWSLKPEYNKTAKWSLYDLQYKLQESGWMVPAYTLPKKLEEQVVMRVVARQGISRDVIDQLLGNIRSAVAGFEKLTCPTESRLALDRKEKIAPTIATHNGPLGKAKREAEKDKSANAA